MPSQAELYHRYFTDKKTKFNSDQLKKLLNKYGGQEHLDIPENIKRDTLLGLQREEDGEQVYGIDEHSEGEVNSRDILVTNKTTINVTTAKSIYPEDIFPNGHKTVWGSFFHDHFGWGFRCCLSNVSTSICKGAEGLKENINKIQEYDKAKLKEREEEQMKQKKREDEINRRNAKEEKEGGAFSESFNRMSNYEQNSKMLNKKRTNNSQEEKYNSRRKEQDTTVTEAEMEAYKTAKREEDDPMKQYLTSKRK